jgi:RecA-family ATPase
MLQYVPILPQKEEKEIPDLTDQPGQLLVVRSANQCIEDAKSQPIPNMLFSQLWYEGELCFLFAETNAGKSILAIQIANSISKGEAINGFKLEAPKQPVLYFDFELSDKQFEKRYSQNYLNHYQFDNNFLRIGINPDYSSTGDFEAELFIEIERAILQYKARVLIIDNLTYLKTQATETAKEALPLMKRLKDLKLKYDLSVLTLAHTPKRNLANPITKNDLAGSKHLANFTDSMFAIGESHQDKSLRYIKQLKARATELIYDPENIILCEIAQHHNFLGFEFQDFGREQDHLKMLTDENIDQMNDSILLLKKQHPHLPDREIARQLGINPMKVGRVLKRNGV